MTEREYGFVLGVINCGVCLAQFDKDSSDKNMLFNEFRITEEELLKYCDDDQLRILGLLPYPEDLEDHEEDE